ncbi:alpha-L-fucosidase [Lysobacter sp. CA199]|uniref:alpha-L-fucosidase n=1 Tax=Lysobacter sp. CA199 TaxID=3455608 RepID=UPI003F8D0A1A
MKACLLALLSGFALLLPAGPVPAAEPATPPPPDAAESPADKTERMQWFADAKLGVFIHWGIYAVDGVDESWAFFNGKMSHAAYMKQLRGFTADRYDPAAWADLIKRSGARYAVLTARHHDGVALWDSQQGVNVVKDTPARRDLIAPFVDALRGTDLKVGLYYSLPDWSYADYDVFTRKRKRYDFSAQPQRWQRFVDYYQGQLAELGERYRPDLYWFDGDWEHDADAWQSAKLRRDILARNPKAIINSRLNAYGDYATPEQGVPVLRPDAPYWELCLTMNRSWGYQPRDEEYKNANQIVHLFADVIGMGGNLLLDIGPRQDGTLDPRQVAILEGLGRWTSKHVQAIYGTVAGPSLDHYAGPSTLSKDRKTLYLFVDGKPSGELLVKGLDSRVSKAYVVGAGQPVPTRVLGKHDWSKVPGLLYLSVPQDAFDPDMTVIALELDGPATLYREASKPITGAQ